MKTFRYDPAKTSQIIKKSMVRILIMWLILGPIVMGVLLFANRNSGSMLGIWFAIPVMLGGMIYSLVRGRKRAKKASETFVLEIGEGEIKAKSGLFGEKRFDSISLKRIVERKDGSFLLDTGEASESILIGAYFEDNEEVKRELENILPFSPDEGQKNGRYWGTLALMVLIFACFPAMGLFTDLGLQVLLVGLTIPMSLLGIFLQYQMGGTHKLFRRALFFFIFLLAGTITFLGMFLEWLGSSH